MPPCKNIWRPQTYLLNGDCILGSISTGYRGFSEEPLSREQLLELHSFLSVNASKLAAIRHIIDGIDSVCENYIVSIPNVCVAVKKWVGEAKGILNNQHDRKRVIDNGESAESPSR